MKSKIKISLLIILGSLMLGACKKLLNTAPTNVISGGLVYNNLNLIDGLLQATYNKLKNDAPEHMVNGAVLLKILSTSYGSDMNTNPNPLYGVIGPFKSSSFYEAESYLPTEYASRGLWRQFYSIIYNSNLMLENIDKVAGDHSQKDAIKGQALTIRARCYFDLIRIYQHTYIIAKDRPGLPLVLSSNINENNSRASVDSVYASILNDLKNALPLLKDYVRPNIAYYDRNVANFLLANVYLTMNDWVNAQIYANKIRTKYPLMTMTEYKNGFGSINEEWVLGYSQTIQDNTNENLATFYDFGQNNTTLPYRLFYPSSQFVNLMQSDPRSLFLVNPTMQGKFSTTKFYEYNSNPPYSDMIDMRAAEMYLVEAEAAVRQGNTSTALNLLNMIQNARPGAPVTTTTNAPELLLAILLERRKEMYGEGLDYFDIKRLQLPVNKSIANGNELNLSLNKNSNILTLMIPDVEILNNKAMVQNPDPSAVPYFIP